MVSIKLYNKNRDWVQKWYKRLNLMVTSSCVRVAMPLKYTIINDKGRGGNYIHYDETILIPKVQFGSESIQGRKETINCKGMLRSCEQQFYLKCFVGIVVWFFHHIAFLTLPSNPSTVNNNFLGNVGIQYCIARSSALPAQFKSELHCLVLF